MKRNNILIWISVLFLALVFSACYDDESTYDTNIIPEVVIDTTGIPARHSVFFNHWISEHADAVIPGHDNYFLTFAVKFIKKEIRMPNWNTFGGSMSVRAIRQEWYWDMNLS